MELTGVPALPPLLELPLLPPLPSLGAQVAAESVRAQKLFLHSEPLGHSATHAMVQSGTDRSGEKQLDEANSATHAATAARDFDRTEERKRKRFPNIIYLPRLTRSSIPASPVTDNRGRRRMMQRKFRPKTRAHQHCPRETSPSAD
jgi:hypothetical protein